LHRKAVRRVEVGRGAFHSASRERNANNHGNNDNRANNSIFLNRGSHT
jgi:hypothetical protein